jgi:hypothetical protein
VRSCCTLRVAELDGETIGFRVGVQPHITVGVVVLVGLPIFKTDKTDKTDSGAIRCRA